MFLTGDEVASLLMTLDDDIDTYVTDGVEYPHVKRAEGGFHVIVENKNVAEVGTIEEALLLLAWGHHVFYGKYVKQTRKGMTFLTKYVLGFLEGSVNTPLSVKKAFKSLDMAGILPRTSGPSGR